jgi:hypothetical protein
MSITIKKSSAGSEYNIKAGEILLLSNKNATIENRYSSGNFIKIRTTQTAGA